MGLRGQGAGCSTGIGRSFRCHKGQASKARCNFRPGGLRPSQPTLYSWGSVTTGGGPSGWSRTYCSNGSLRSMKRNPLRVFASTVVCKSSASNGITCSAGFAPYSSIMKLVVDEPVIGHIENRSIIQEELRQIRSLFAVGVHRRLVDLRTIGCRTRGGDSGVIERPEPEEVTGRPPTRVQSPERSAENKKYRRKRANRTTGWAKTGCAECDRRRARRDSGA